MPHIDKPSRPSPARLQAQRAAVAVGVAPFLVLLGLTLVVGGMIEPDIGLAIFAACTAWLVHELYRYQKTVDAAMDEAAASDTLAPLLGAAATAAVQGGCDNAGSGTLLEAPPP